MQKTLKGKILIAVLVTVLAVATALSIGLTLGLNNSNVAEAAKDANFNQLTNGSTWQYTTSTYTRTTVTVNTNSTHGTKANPYVISNATQWESFASYVNTGKTSVNTFAILGANIDFGNNAVTPAGLGTYAFSGQFYGQNFTISNAKMKNVSVTFKVSENPADQNITKNVSGLFAVVKGATIGDIALKNVQITAHDTNFAGGGLAAVAAEVFSGDTGVPTNAYTTLVNVSNTTNYTLTVKPTSNGVDGQAQIGGLVGLTSEGINVLRCAYRGNFAVTESNAGGWVFTNVGGLVARVSKNATYKVDGCFVQCDLLYKGETCGYGSAFGGDYLQHSAGTVYKISNSVFYATFNTASTVASLWCGVTGCDANQGSGSSFTNVYVDQNFTFCYGEPITYSNVKATTCQASNAAGGNGKSYETSRYAGKTGLTVTEYSSSASATLRNQAKTAVQSGQISGLVINSSGAIGIANEAGSIFSIVYVLGSNATWSKYSTTDTYTISSSAQNLTKLDTRTAANNPTRTGFTFKGWSYTDGGSLINNTGTGAIPASKSGTLSFYAVWEITPGVATNTSTTTNVTYEATNVRLSATVAVAAATGATPSVVVSNYKWSKLNASGGYDNVNTTTGTHAQTVSTVSSNLSISFTLPTVAQSGTYRLSWTISSATSGDITPARTLYCGAPVWARVHACERPRVCGRESGHRCMRAPAHTPRAWTRAGG